MSSDYQLEDTLYLPFTTRAFATGIPTALVSGAVDIYEDVTATPIITGETLAVSLNSVAGFNMITVTATAGTGFGAGQSYTAILQAGTVDSVSVVGEVVAHFTLDMSAAAKDLANGTDGLGAIKAETANIVTDTGEIGAAGAGLTNINLPNQTMDIVGSITGNLSGSVGSVTGHTNQTGDNFAIVNGSAGLVAIDTVVDAIKVATDKLAFTVANQVDANVLGIVGVSQSATNLEASTDTILLGTASGTPSTTAMVSDISITVDDQFKGRVVIFASDTSTAALQGQATNITACTASSNTLTFSALTTAPSSGDTFVVV